MAAAVDVAMVHMLCGRFSFLSLLGVTLLASLVSYLYRKETVVEYTDWCEPFSERCTSETDVYLEFKQRVRRPFQCECIWCGNALVRLGEHEGVELVRLLTGTLFRAKLGMCSYQWKSKERTRSPRPERTSFWHGRYYRVWTSCTSVA
jgi:hypothetical protein